MTAGAGGQRCEQADRRDAAAPEDAAPLRSGGVVGRGDVVSVRDPHKIKRDDGCGPLMGVAHEPEEPDSGASWDDVQRCRGEKMQRR